MVLQYQGLFLVLALCTILHLRQVESFYTSSTSQFGNIGRTKKCTTIPSSIATTKPWQRQVQVIQQQINLVAKKKTTRIKSSNSDNAFSYEPVFDFSDDDNGNDMTLKFERIDDVIMGGVSSSTFKRNPNELFARWSGICRIDGGYVRSRGEKREKETLLYSFFLSIIFFFFFFCVYISHPIIILLLYPFLKR